jgi:hypothetical protein
MILAPDFGGPSTGVMQTMRLNRFRIGLCGWLAVIALVPVTAQAGPFQKALIGLSEAGFNFVAEENFISGGADLIVSRNFVGETLDFGAAELTLQGTPVFTLTTGGRGLDLLEVSLNTGGNPFNYTLTTDTGNQLTTLTGSFLMDASATINEFGFYDVTLEVSSRQTFTNDGRFSDDPLLQDFDLGPVDLRGNIYADLLAVVTEPIFNLLGVDNIFAQFSASGQFEAKLDAQAKALRAKALAGEVLSAEEIAELGTVMSLAAAWGVEAPDVSFLGDWGLGEDPLAAAESLGATAQLIPEPHTLLLLGACVPALLRRRRVR